MDINHIALGARDPVGLAEFYERVFGLRRMHVAYMPDGSRLRAVWLEVAPHVVLMIEYARRSGSPPGEFEIASFPPGYRLITLSIDRSQRDHWLKRLADAGVDVVHESDYTLYVLDPEGNPFGLSWFDVGAYLTENH